MTAPLVLDQRTLNRTLLARQGLLERATAPAADVIERLVGLQAQEPWDPYVGLWSRIADFDPMTLADLLTTRSAIRLMLMRGTIHLVTARDGVAIRPLVQPVLDRVLGSQRAFREALAAVDRATFVAGARLFVEQEPRTRAAIRAWVDERVPGTDAASLAIAVTYLLPVVQVTPRAVWGHTAQARWTTLSAWIGDGLASAAEPMAPATLVHRYLAAFGPATVSDMRTWSGLAGLREVLAAMRAELRTFRDERDRELFDLPDGVMVDPETPAPVRFLPVYDNAVLAHDDRSRIVALDDRRRIVAAGPSNVGSVLVDGFGRAVWRLQQHPAEALLDVALLHGLSPSEEAAVGEEGERFLTFLAPDSAARRVAFRHLSTA